MVVAQNTKPPPIVSWYNRFERMIEPPFGTVLVRCEVLCPVLDIISVILCLELGSINRFRQGRPRLVSAKRR